MYCLRHSSRAIALLCYLLTIYRTLDFNDISVIEDNAFNNLPRLNRL